MQGEITTRHPSLGYCCVSLGKYESKFKTTTLSWAKGTTKAKAVEKLLKLWENNLEELSRVLNYNISAGIRLYRMSSDLFPLADHPKYEKIWDDFSSLKSTNTQPWREARNAVAEFISAKGRLTFHPGQYVSIGSPQKNTRNSAIKNLELHGTIMSLLDLPETHESPINIHLSNGKDNIQLLPYFTDTLSRLSTKVKKRLVFETEDKSFWTWQKITKYFPEYPVTLDSHHHRINNEGDTLEEAFASCAKSWGSITPVVHVSEGKTEELDRAHHDWVNSIPNAFYSEGTPNKLKADIEIEAKKKDLAVLYLQSRYRLN